MAVLFKAYDHQCVDCGRSDLLDYDHVPDYEETGHTVTTELELRCPRATMIGIIHSRSRGEKGLATASVTDQHRTPLLARVLPALVA